MEPSSIAVSTYISALLGGKLSAQKLALRLVPQRLLFQLILLKIVYNYKESKWICL